MNKVGIQSQGLDTMNVSFDSLKCIYENVKKAGFDCIDFNFDEYLPVNDVFKGEFGDSFNGDIEEVWKPFKPQYEAAKAAGLTFEQSHAPFPLFVDGDETVFPVMKDITEKCIDMFGRMGGRYIVVHPVTLAYKYSKEEEIAKNREAFKTLIPAAKKAGVVICLENLFLERNYHLCEGICSDPHDAIRLIDELNDIAGEELFGFCFDTGHANICGKNLYQFIVALGDRIKILHIHDNDGVSDLHSIPYTFERSWAGLSTDWEGFVRGLKDINYKGNLNFETFRGLTGFPKEVRPAVLHLLADVGKHFASLI